MSAKKRQQPEQHLSPAKFVREKGRTIPVEVCYLDEDSLKEYGESHAIIVRQHKGGRRTIGCYLVDVWCRGVKDAFYLVRMEELDYEEFRERILSNPSHNMVEVPYEVFHNWIYGAIEFAEEAGLAPHKDFAVAQYLLEEDDERIPLIEYEFGHNGKHHLVCDSMDELLRLKPVLDEHLGPGNYTWGINGFAEDADILSTEDLFREEDSVTRLTLRIELQNVKPLIWRKVEIPSNLTLIGFHELIQAVMGWANMHLHSFRSHGVSIEEEEESAITVGDMFRGVSSFVYEYDFGDSWVHRIMLMRSEPSSEDDRTVRVLSGKNACPPEDFGGPWQYSDFVEAFTSGDKTRYRRNYDETLEWIGGEFNPTFFDLEDTQAYVEDLFGE